MKNEKRYSEDWKAIIRPKMLAKANFKCQKCHIRQRAYGYYETPTSFIECDLLMADWAKKNGFKVQRVWLQVVHVDQNPANNKEQNLRVLCPRCHFDLDRPHNVAKRSIKKPK